MTATCVIFDVDGTLVQSASFEDTLYIAAVRSSLGEVFIRRDWSEYEHVTDVGILRGICRENRIAPGDCEDLIRSRFGALVSDHLLRLGPCAPIPGAIPFLNELHARGDVEVGIATGGWGHTARMKLDSAGFELAGIPIASSDDGCERTRIMEKCRAQMSSTGATVYVGDAEWDLRASELLRWRFIGVGSRLRGRCPDWVPDFSAPGLVRSLFG
jgi:phosphoglycolate phosphatase-like HAD superfamily hydrolase